MEIECSKKTYARKTERQQTKGFSKLEMLSNLQVWDEELAAVAQAHADQCKFEHDCADCRRVDR